jgi:hypothetical protein
MAWNDYFCFFKFYVKMKKYNIISIFFGSDFGHVSIVMWFSGMIFHKAQIYVTHIVLVMEVGVEFQVIWFVYMQNVIIRICVEWTCFPNPQIETHPKPPTVKHIGIPLYYIYSCFTWCIQVSIFVHLEIQALMEHT